MTQTSSPNAITNIGATYTKGDYVRISPYGERQRPRQMGRTGRIVGYSKTSGCYRIKWDGIKSAYTLHNAFFEANKEDWRTEDILQLWPKFDTYEITRVLRCPESTVYNLIARHKGRTEARPHD